jgi:hypothetical protein
MSAATQLAPSSVPEDANASIQQTLGAHPEITSNTGQSEIAQLAYMLWQQRGCPEGTPEVDWLNAEQQLTR